MHHIFSIMVFLIMAIVHFGFHSLLMPNTFSPVIFTLCYFGYFAFVTPSFSLGSLNGAIFACLYSPWILLLTATMVPCRRFCSATVVGLNPDRFRRTQPFGFSFANLLAINLLEILLNSDAVRCLDSGNSRLSSEFLGVVTSNIFSISRSTIYRRRIPRAPGDG